jgi:hypothetical protein
MSRNAIRTILAIAAAALALSAPSASADVPEYNVPFNVDPCEYGYPADDTTDAYGAPVAPLPCESAPLGSWSYGALS